MDDRVSATEGRVAFFDIQKGTNMGKIQQDVFVGDTLDICEAACEHHILMNMKLWKTIYESLGDDLGDFDLFMCGVEAGIFKTFVDSATGAIHISRT